MSSHPSALESSSLYPRLLGDVGGTNARFALQLQPGGAPMHVGVLAAADCPGIAEAVQRYLTQGELPRPRSACLGVASPVLGDEVRFINSPWSFSVSELRQRLGVEHLKVLNDFTALALSLPVLPAEELVQVGGGAPVQRKAVAVLGPGTGLGVSGLLPVGDDGWTAIEGEGGHVTLSACNDEETAVLAALRQQFKHVSAERALSGPGLVALYTAHRRLVGGLPRDLLPAEVIAQALSGEDESCMRAVNSFCEFLGTVAADLALTLGAQGGVYIGGGIVPKLGEFFARSGFRKRFEDKGRYGDYMARIPTWVIHSPYPGLVGAGRA